MGRIRAVMLASVFAFGCSQGKFAVVTDEDAAGDATTGETAVDTGKPDTPVGEACVPNDCGGCGPITVKLGTACGTCGVWLCEKGAAKCIDPGLNECGGCATLSAKVGGACGGASCGSGTFACDGKEALKCSVPANECGGCKKLDNPPGGKCGGCGTWTCSTDRESTFCNEKTNVCGGCTTILDTPGTKCGSCGKFVCSTDKTKLDCAEATPAVGSACGFCGTSTNYCAGVGLTACSKPDDRSRLTDIKYTDTTDLVAITSRMQHVATAWLTTVKNGQIVKITMKLKRVPYLCTGVSVDPIDGGLGTCSTPDPSCKCTVADGGCSCAIPAPAEGSLIAYLYKGTPGGSLTPLGSVSVPASTISNTSVSDVAFNFPGTVSAVAAGTNVFVWLYSFSDAFGFEVWGGVAPPTSLTSATQARYPTVGTWTPAKATAAIQVESAGCP